MDSKRLAWAFMFCPNCGTASRSSFAVEIEDLSDDGLRRVSGISNNSQNCPKCTDTSAFTNIENGQFDFQAMMRQPMAHQVNGIWLLSNMAGHFFDGPNSQRPSQEEFRQLEKEVARLKSVKQGAQERNDRVKMILSAIRAINPQMADLLGLAEWMNWPVAVVAGALLYALGKTLDGSNYPVARVFADALLERLRDWLKQDEPAE